MLEGDHDFEVTITNPGEFATLGTPSLTTVTIDDDEREFTVTVKGYYVT